MKIRNPSGVVARKAGFTLAEVTIAMAIIGIAAAGVIGAFNCGFLLIGGVRENQRATQVILEKMETIRLYNWSQVNSNGYIPSTFTDCYDPQAVSGSQGVVYNGSLTITNFPFSTSYSTNMRQLTVSLQWRGTGNINRTRKVTTYISRDGIQNYVY